ncbi:MAG: lipoate--protein ligase family protein [Nitrospirae bacterium]|nr:MAG: lipoate--protein ligase family protein [Nitrospirota bacterium]
MYWRLIDSGSEDAYLNMAIDEAIAMMVLEGNSPPTLRFYGWKGRAVTLGAFQRLSEINREYCEKSFIPLVRRPTGGRAILHGEDLTYSFSSLNSPPFFSENLLKTYAYISQAFLKGFMKMGVDVEFKKRRERGRVLTGSSLCFQSVSYGEITLKGKKLIGSAQKRWKRGFLQQGSLLLKTNADEMERVFLRAKGEEILKSMVGLFEVYPMIKPEDLKSAFIKGFEEVFKVSFRPEGLTQKEIELAQRLVREKYKNPKWLNYRV